MLTRAAPTARVEQATTAAEFAQALARGEFDVVVVERQLGWGDGLSLLHAIQERRPEAAVVVLTRIDAAPVAVELLKAGASDFLVKSSKSYLQLPSAVDEAARRVAAVGPDALRLRERLDQLERMTRDLAEFPYTAAHELHAPLRAVTRHLERVERTRDQLEPDIQRALAAAATGIRWMQTLIDDLLTYSRIGTERETFSACDLNALVDRAIGQVAAESETADASVTRGELPTVSGDPAQLLLVFRNLLSNAVKFRAEKTPRVDVSARVVGDDWVFSVRDNGIGIDRGSAQDIFGMFKRLHPEYPGTGVGLAICRRIVERHHGRIWVDSDAGAGATFSFTLPRTAGLRRPGPSASDFEELPRL